MPSSCGILPARPESAETATLPRAAPIPRRRLPYCRSLVEGRAIQKQSIWVWGCWSLSVVEPHKPEKPDRRDEPALRHAPQNNSWHLFLSRTIRRKASCCHSRRRRCIGMALGLLSFARMPRAGTRGASLLSEIRQEHQNVAHRNHADQFSTLRHAEMSNTLLGHQIAGI